MAARLKINTRGGVIKFYEKSFSVNGITVYPADPNCSESVLRALDSYREKYTRKLMEELTGV
jgi:hypothetical protein